MWPHVDHLLLGGVPVAVGTDDPGVADAWQPWVGDADRLPELIDYGVETAPSGPEDGRPLAVVRHGSAALGRATDPAVVVDGFWRVLGDLARASDDLGLDLSALVLDDGVLLVDRSIHVSHRRFAAVGARHLPVHRVRLVDGDAPTVWIAAPLVGGDEIRMPLLGCVAARTPTSDLTRAGEVAALAGSLDTARQITRDDLDGLASLLDRVPFTWVRGERAAGDVADLVRSRGRS